jgi:hypothetical protein
VGPRWQLLFRPGADGMQLTTGRTNVSDAPWPHSLRSHPIFDQHEEFQQLQQLQSGV